MLSDMKFLDSLREYDKGNYSVIRIFSLETEKIKKVKIEIKITSHLK
jgi:hypothetical protein